MPRSGPSAGAGGEGLVVATDPGDPRGRSTGEPDPVVAFAASTERALRQLRAEVARLKAEHDGLRFEQLQALSAWLPAPEPAPRRDVVDALAIPDRDRRLGDVDPTTTPRQRDAPRRRILTRLAPVLGILAVALVLVVSVGPLLLPYRTYVVRSGSMAPAIPTGALVVATKVDASTLEVGDVITFEHPTSPDTFVTHRIVRVEDGERGRVFATKGDANAAEDHWRVQATGKGWKHAVDVPHVGSLFGSLGTSQARLLLAVAGVVLGLLAVVARRRRTGVR